MTFRWLPPDHSSASIWLPAPLYAFRELLRQETATVALFVCPECTAKTWRAYLWIGVALVVPAMVGFVALAFAAASPLDIRASFLVVVVPFMASFVALMTPAAIRYSHLPRVRVERIARGRTWLKGVATAVLDRVEMATPPDANASLIDELVRAIRGGDASDVRTKTRTLCRW
jgi:hypothetical protein